ncbi:MAG: hypothetical protein OQJ76_02735 [Rhodospirillales bacterium]|nr:hypothetical protein [Rhodospirillales bacterium]
MTEQLDAVRRAVMDGLPGFIARAHQAYADFSEDGAEGAEAAKAFSAHHAACKAALAHIEALVKLSRWAAAEDGSAQDDGAEALIAEARAALLAMEAEG